jgi:hypothetical protein
MLPTMCASCAIPREDHGYVDLGQVDLMVREGVLFEPNGFHPDGHP